jgi:hypothetical protein
VLYALDAAQPGDLKDITTASPLNPASPNNDATGTNKGMFPVTAGYDMATGLGTPNVAAVAGEMCALRAPLFTVTVAGPKRASATLRKSTHIAVSGTDSGKIALSYAAKGLPKGLTMSPKGVIIGKSTKTGKFTVTVTATDHATNTASTTFTLKVVGPPATISHTRLSGVARRRPVLSFDVSRGHFGARLSSLTLHLPTGLTFGKRGRGISLRSGRHKVHFKVGHSKTGITIDLKKPEKTVRVTITRPSLFASAKLAKTARHAKKASVQIQINVTDAGRRTTRRAINLRLKR